jgi:hypothetical protein
MNNKIVTPMAGHNALKEDVTKRSKLGITRFYVCKLVI